MLRSSNYETDLYLRELNKEKDVLDLYALDVLNRNYISFSDTDNFMEIFSTNLDGLSYNDLCDLRDYTGYKYREINSKLRGIISSSNTVLLTGSKLEEVTALENNISRIISLHSSLPTDIIVYRGVTIEQFMQYGITSLEELQKLKDEFLYESAFTSTSLVREKSFFKKKSDYHDICNIEIEYRIPSESMCGIPLVGYDTSYSMNQFEYLIDKGSVTKITDVSFDEFGFAYLKAQYIPKHVWNKSYANVDKNK